MPNVLVSSVGTIGICKPIVSTMRSKKSSTGHKSNPSKPNVIQFLKKIEIDCQLKQDDEIARLRKEKNNPYLYKLGDVVFSL